MLVIIQVRSLAEVLFFVTNSL